MAKKKQTRDVPLPSSDGMFGGPGDPKKKYTASDSASYIKTYERAVGLSKKVKFLYDNPSGNIAKDRAEFAKVISMRDANSDTLRKNAYDETFKARNRGYIKANWSKSDANPKNNCLWGLRR
jgi:hypothetical protein